MSISLPLMPLSSNNHGPYVVSASDSASDAYTAFDNNSETYWSDTGSSWVKIDLGIPYAISEAYICWRHVNGSASGSAITITISGSQDDSSYSTIYSGSYAKANTSTFNGYTVTCNTTNQWRYIRINFSSSATYTYRLSDFILTSPYEPSYGLATDYYVSQQTGDDSNDGLTSQTAWATLTKVSTSTLPVQNTPVTVHVAPGIYRETLRFNCSFIESETITIKGDPDCLYFPECRPGVVRISAYNEDEQTIVSSDFYTSLDFMFFSNGKIVFDSFEIISPVSGIFGADVISCKIWTGLYGIVNFSVAKNCEIYSNHVALYGKSTTESKAYNCVCFSNRSAFHLSSCYHCFGIGLTGFNSCVSYNCAAQYSTTGFSSGSCYNCIASNCQNGFTSTAGSNRKSIGCSANTGDSAGSAFYFLPEIKTLVNNGLLNKGVPVINNPTDLLELDRATGDGNLDIGPIENCDYSLDYDNFYTDSPAIKINREGQLSFKFRVNAGTYTIKQVAVKHINTSEDLKPQVIIRGLGIEIIKSASFEGNMWEQLTISFTAPADGVMEIVLCACDTNENSYSLFSDIL